MRSKRMKSVQRLMGMHEQNAARQFGISQDQLSRNQAQLQELIEYRNEYARGFRETTRRALGAHEMQDYYLFLKRLNQAIREQQQVIDVIARDHETHKTRWLNTRSKTKAVEKVVDRYRNQERYEQDQREQRESDHRSQYGRRALDE